MDDLTILLPCAGRSSRFPGMRPKWMLAAPDGRLMLDHSLQSVGATGARVVVAIRREHEERYQALVGIRKALGEEVEVIVLEEETKGPADTVNEMITRAGVAGSIFVQDADSWYLPTGQVQGNMVRVADLRENLHVTQVAVKSFISVNEQMLITSIIEKSVASNYISVGGYGFESASLFTENFEKLMNAGQDGEIYLSHVIMEAIVNDEVFIAQKVEDYTDVGTNVNWMAYRENHPLLAVDIDGVVFKNKGEYFPPYWSEEDEIIEANVKKLLELQDKGAQIIFMTARKTDFREKTEAKLKNLGFKWHALVFNCNHGRRYMINDYATTNPYPSAVAVNLPRDADTLEKLFP